MKIFLNGEEKILETKMTIAELVEKFELDVKKIAVENNYEIILPEEFEGNILSEGDRVEIVHFIGGG